MTERTATHRLVIELDEAHDTYRLFFVGGKDDRRMEMATLRASFAMLDEAGDVLDAWRTCVEASFLTCVADMTGYPPDHIKLERFNLTTYAHLQES